MAPLSSLSPAAPVYIPKRAAPWMSPPPEPCFATYICMPPPPPEFLPWPPLAPPPPPPPPCWGIIPRVPCVPEMPGPFHGGVVPLGVVPEMPMMTPSRPALSARRAAAPSATAVPCGVKAAGDAKAATNQPSPRSVLAAPSPPISPTTSLPTSFPYPLVLPAPLATADIASAAAPFPAEGGSVAVRPPQRRRLRGPGRARPAPRVQVRRTVDKPRRLFDPTSERTSLMIRNIPNDFTRARLLNILDAHCFIENEKVAPGGVRSAYDFLYLPIDFRSHANKGYAFVNMTSPEAARRLWDHLNGNRWAFKRTAKTCAIDYAVRQGLELVEHFSGTRFECPTEEYLPVRFEPPRDGTRPAVGAMHVVGRLAHRPFAAAGK